MKQKKIVVIHQPDFMPWLGFFDRWKRSEIYIILDDVQFLRRGWHHRDKIKTKNGAKWLTVPVIKKGKYHQLIRDVKIDNQISWRSKHLNTIEANYKKAPYFEYYITKLRNVYDKKHTFLIDLNMSLLHLFAQEFGIITTNVFASDKYIKSTSTQRLVDLVKSVDGTAYFTGIGSKKYIDNSLFIKENIEIIWQEFNHLVYPQLHGDFIPNLSCLDFVMNCSPAL